MGKITVVISELQESCSLYAVDVDWMIDLKEIGLVTEKNLDSESRDLNFPIRVRRSNLVKVHTVGPV